MLSGISFPEVLPLGLQEERPFGAKFMPLPEFECGDMSPRVSTGPSACSMASSSSEIEGVNDLFAFPLAHGNKPTITAAHHDQSLLIKQQQSADAEMQKHQQQYWPQMMFYPPTQGQLPLVTLDEDLEDALGMFCSPSCDPPLDFGPSPGSSVPLALHQPCGATEIAAPPAGDDLSPVMLPSKIADVDIEIHPSSSGGSDKKQKTRRRVGRPRVQAPPPATTTIAAGDTEAAAASGAAGQQKRGRGPKPKYVFATTDEALDARKERNRKAALESYYRKRQKTQALNQEIEKLEAENALLKKLATEIECGNVVLEEASEEGLNAWLAGHI